MPDAEQLFNQWARGPWDPEDDEYGDSDSEFGWGDCDGNHPFGEHCEICASSLDCYCSDCYAYGGAFAGDESFRYYYRLFYWYYYCFYMEYYHAHYAERAARGSQSRHDRDEYL